jgi:hypothetical protein
VKQVKRFRVQGSKVKEKVSYYAAIKPWFIAREFINLEP